MAGRDVEGTIADGWISAGADSGEDLLAQVRSKDVVDVDIEDEEEDHTNDNDNNNGEDTVELRSADDMPARRMHQGVQIRPRALVSRNEAIRLASPRMFEAFGHLETNTGNSEEGVRGGKQAQRTVASHLNGDGSANNPFFLS